MQRRQSWLLGLALVCAACGNSAGGGGTAVGEDAACADDACADAAVDAAGDAQDVASAADVGLNDVVGAEVSADAADGQNTPDAEATDAGDADVKPDAADVAADAGDDVKPDAVDAEADAGDDVAEDVDAAEDVADVDDVADVADVPEDVDVADVPDVDDAADGGDVLDAADDVDAGAALVDPWTVCPATQPTVLYQAADWVQELRIYGGQVYWTAYGPNFTAESWVHAMPITGVPVGALPSTLMVGSLNGTTAFQGLDVDATGVYVSGDGKGAILTAPLTANGTQPATVLVGQEQSAVMLALQPRQLTIFGGMIYFREDEYTPFTFPPGIRQVATSGGVVSSVAGVPKTAGYPHINSAGLAFIAASDAAASIVGGVYFLAAGGNVPQLLSAGTEWKGMDIDASAVFWSQVGGGPDGVWQASMATGAATQIAQMSGAGVLVQDDATANVYFYASKVDGPYLKHAIFKVAKSGGAVTPVVCNLPGAVWGMRSDATNVYFSFADGKSTSWKLAPDGIAAVPK